MYTTFSPDEIMQKLAAGKPFTVLIFLSGKPAPEDESLASQLQMEHLSYLFQMEAEGKCCVFGPMVNDKRLRGLIVFNTASQEDVHQWMSVDPWVKGGYLAYELYDWFSIPGQRIPG